MSIQVDVPGVGLTDLQVALSIREDWSSTVDELLMLDQVQQYCHLMANIVKLDHAIRVAQSRKVDPLSIIWQSLPFWRD